MKKIVVTFGLISGGILAAMMWLTLPFLEKIGSDKGALIGYTSMVLAFLMVFGGVKAYRDNVGGGTVTFGRAFRVGISIALVGMVLYIASWEIMFRTMVPDFMDKYTAQVVKEQRAAGKPEAEVAKAEAAMKQTAELYNNNMLVRVGYTALEPLPVALLMSLIAAGTLRRKKVEAV